MAQCTPSCPVPRGGGLELVARFRVRWLGQAVWVGAVPPLLAEHGRVDVSHMDMASNDTLRNHAAVP